ncbi:MAG: hypothetical protein FJ098_07645 [Deltaproteobacteria bacterium]|nr:hypothetical protein [Deltaproteobacteria bacterium]
MVAAHPEWAGQVVALLVNANGAQSGIPGCAATVGVPILQDGGGMWGTLGATSYTAQVYAPGGILAFEITAAFFASSPAKVTELEEAVSSLL